MKIMLIEDCEQKRGEIRNFLLTFGVRESDIVCVANMTDFSANLHLDIGLFIVDFYIPYRDNVGATSNGRAILESIIKHGKKNALLIAISSYPDEFAGLRDYYQTRGCVLVDYNNQESWQGALSALLTQLNGKQHLDFLIFCALHEERSPYVALLGGKKEIRNGVDILEVQIDEFSGGVVLLPQMGLVNAAITAGLCIDRYRPKVVAMSGICGGFESRAKMGQLFVCKMAYEYQSGKWSQDGFKHEPYQCPTDHETSLLLRQLIDQEGLLQDLECDFKGVHRPSEKTAPSLGIFTSGSAVIADSELLTGIELIHRKVNALDMEIFAIHRAAEISCSRPPCISAKVVVDLCNQNKNDDLHAYGCFVSANFVIKAISSFLAKMK